LKRYLAFVLVACLGSGVAACSTDQLQTGVALASPVMQTALDAYVQKHPTDTLALTIGNDLIAAAPLFVASGTSPGTTQQKVVASAITAVGLLEHDEPSATVMQYAPTVLASLQSIQAGASPASTAEAMLGQLLVAYLVDKAL
jgi:hypothetical protein